MPKPESSHSREVEFIINMEEPLIFSKWCFINVEYIKGKNRNSIDEWMNK